MRTLFSSLHLELDFFKGPLDVFVHLAHRRELSPHSISLKEILSKLTSQLIDFESASHFLEQFTLLMLFKSRDCLPFEENKQLLDTSPPEEAIIHLSDYYKFKEIACRLDQRQEEEGCRFFRGTQEEIPLPPPGLEQISIEQLQLLFQKVLERLPKTHGIKRDRYTIEDGKQLIINSLTKGSLNLHSFLSAIDNRGLVIVAFLAILELMKEGTIFVKPDYELTMKRGSL